mgnify:CR=1 FL=1
MDDFMDQGLEKEKKKKSKVKKLISSVVDFKKKQNLEMDNSDLPSTVPEEIEYEQDENGRLQTEVKKGIKQMLKQNHPTNFCEVKELPAWRWYLLFLQLK